MVSSSSRIVMTLLGTGVSAFIMSAAATPAWAQGAFAPSGTWSINRIDPKNGSASYCTLARKFSGNTVITFARNTGGEGTIAIDFNQALFDTKQTYRIGLQAGDGIKREFMTRPATGGALVLRTGEDAAFFDALGNSTELGVIMDGTRYAFSLPDFGTGVNQLYNCITAAASAPTNIRETAKIDEAALANSPEIRAMRAELDKLRSENDSIVSALKADSATRASTTNNAESAELVARVQALETEKNQLVERLQSNQTQDLRDMSELRIALEEQKNLRNLLQAEREQRERLEASLKEQTAVAEQRGELRARINLLEASNTELKTLRASLDSERKKREQAETAAALSLEEQERLRARLSELESQNKTLSADAARFADVKVKLEDISNQAAQERARREATEAALKTSQIAIANRESELSVLQTKLETEREKLQAAQKTQQDALTREHQAEISRLQALISDLQGVQEQSLNEQARRTAAENTVREMQVQMASREDTIADLQKQLIAARENKQSKAEIERLQSRLTELQDAQNQSVAEQARRTAAENTVREMQAQMAAREGAIADLEKQLAVAREGKENKAEIARLQKRINELQELQANAQGEAARRIAAENTVREMQTKMAALETQLNAAKNDNSSQSKIAKLEAELQALRTASNDAQTRLEAETARRVASEQTIASLQKQLASPDNSQTGKLATRLAAMEEHNNELMQRLRDAQSAPNKQAELQELRTLLEAETARRKQAEAAFASAGSASERDAVLTQRLTELETRNAELTARLSAQGTAGDAAQTEALRRQLTILQQDNEQLAIRLARVASEPAPTAINAGRVVYTGGDSALAESLAETQSTLEAVMAERNEYRNLLQRERASQSRTGNAANTTSSNAQIAALEAERVELIRQLEFERTRLLEVSAGREAPPSESEARLNKRLAALEAEKASLEKQLRVTQQDVIDARSSARTNDNDVSELLAENRRLQAELAASANRGSSGDAAQDVKTLQAEIATLRAQNAMLNDEVSRRLAAVPDRAQIDNANARAEHAAQAVQAQMSGALNTANARFEQAEAENIRLARELAAARAAAAQAAAQPKVATVPAVSAPVSAPAPTAQAAVPVVVATANARTVSRPIVDTPTDSPYAQAPTYQHISVSPNAVAPSAPAPAVDPYANVGPDGRAISSYLQRAGIPMVSGFEKITRVSTADFAAFRWDTGVVFGTAEQKLSHASGVDAAMNEYLQKTRTRCSGTYDQSIATVGKVTTADVACIMPDGNGAGAAVVFFYSDGVFNIVAHEGTLDTFEQAMTTRDRLANFLQGQM